MWLFPVIMVWIIGWHGTYLWHLTEYMQKHKIKNIKTSSKCHQKFADDLYMKCMFKWPILTFGSIK